MSDQKIKPGVGFGIMILQDGKILLGRRHDDAEKADSALHGEGTWTMPGGKLHFGETFEVGACREVMEETGLIVLSENLKLISLANEIMSDVQFVTAGFLCEKFEGEPKVMEPDEITQWQWFSLNDLPEKVFPPSMKVIENYHANRIYKANDR